MPRPCPAGVPRRNGAGCRYPVEFSLLRGGPAADYGDRVLRVWRALAYLATGVPVGLLALVLLPFAPLGVGVPIGALERRRLRLVDPRAAPSPHRPPGPRGWLATRLREQATWQELAFTALAGVLLWPVDLAVVVAAVGISGITLLAPLVVAVAPASAVPNGLRLAHAGVIWLVPLLGVLVAVAMGAAVVSVARLRAALTR